MPDATTAHAVEPAGGGCLLRLTVRTNRDGVRFPAGYDPWRQSLLVDVDARPVDGAANRALIQAAADFFGVEPAAVAIAAGKTGRSKRLRIAGVGARVAARRLDAALAD